MKKIGIILQREYLTRVRNKTFLVSTFLFPTFMILFVLGAAYLGVQGKQQSNIAIADDTGIYGPRFKNTGNITFTYNTEITQDNFRQKGFDGLLKIYAADGIHPDSVRLYAEKQLGLSTDEAIRRQIQQINEDNLLMQRGISRSMLDSIHAQSTGAAEMNYRSYKISGTVIKEDNKELSYAIGFGSGIIIYITLFVYGASVMRGVMEEKMNRIAEVMVSSVKPFQLMMGKILGIAAVGLTQLLLWIGLLILLSGLLPLMMPAELMQQAAQMQQGMNMGTSTLPNNTALKMLEVRNTVMTANWALIIGCFLFYFLGGYLFYASLFAAVGSVINEDPQEAQSLMLPITLPIVLGFIMMTSSIENPSGPLAFWGSIIPFTSPIVMMARIPSGVPDTVPYWQLAVSMLLLVGGFFFTTWLSAKIYRTGILLYGKKITLKEMARWAFRRA